jgi:hypothetical protein
MAWRRTFLAIAFLLATLLGNSVVTQLPMAMPMDEDGMMVMSNNGVQASDQGDCTPCEHDNATAAL